MLSTKNHNINGLTQEETQVTTDLGCATPPAKKQRLMGALRFRAAAAQEVKSAVMYSISPFQDRSPKSLQRVQCSLQQSALKVPNNRPIQEIDGVSEKGTPRRIKTPGGTKLSLKKDYGIVRIFTAEQNNPLNPAQPYLTNVDSDKKTQIENSDAYHHIKSNQESTKQQVLWVSASQVQKAKQEIEANHGRRKCSQRKAMVQAGISENKGSANEYGKQFIDNLKIKYYEWMHLIQHRLLAGQGQKEENLVCGTFHANTDMMFIEFQHSLLSEHYPKGYKLSVTANVVQGLSGSQFSTTIDYVIETEDFRLPFRFNGQSDVVPNVFNLDYVEALVLASIPMLRNTPGMINASSPIFFSRKRKLDFMEADSVPALELDAAPTASNCIVC